MSRAYPNQPLAGVAGLVVKDRAILLVQRGHAPAQGAWGLPGGAVELGETLTEALTREIAEECGISIRVGPPVAVLDSIHRDSQGRIEYHYVLVDFWAEYAGGELKAASDAAAAAWVELQDLGHYRLAPITAELLASLGLDAGQGLRPPTGVIYRSRRR